MRYDILIFLISIFLFSCAQNDTKQKELELKERELALKEKEPAIKEKDTEKELELEPKVGSNISDTIKIPLVQQDDLETNIPIAKVPLTKAADMHQVHPLCNTENTPHVTGYAPLVDMYCGVLGQKPIEIYITSQVESTRTIGGYTIVGNSKIYFNGKYTSKDHKGTGQNQDYNSTTYFLILREPTSSNKNGVFKLKLYISDVIRDGEGTWVSYDGLLYREINLYDSREDLALN